jgi:peptidoglycan-associated lipoprotein
MTRSSRVLSLLLLAAAVGAAACRKEAAAPIVTPEPDTTATTVDSAAIRDSLDRARRLAEEEARRLAEGNSADRERRLAEMRAALGAPVYFDYNQAELADDARATLDAKVPVLVANPGLRLRIAGHTDDRGSDEYNIALGQRRAVTVREYLAARGVDAARLDIVSFGEEMPAVPGQDEGAWAQNRRAEFEVVAGEITNVGEPRP